VSDILKVANLTKRFGGVTAVDDCSFAVQEHSITALIGPNGSGKTTAFNLITGYLPADSGIVTFSGRAVRADIVQIARVTKRGILCEHDLHLSSDAWGPGRRGRRFPPHIAMVEHRCRRVVSALFQRCFAGVPVVFAIGLLRSRRVLSVSRRVSVRRSPLLGTLC
jgi:ABC-type cobalamin/Fe3+-siderophores transport system ATPase subunit